MSKMSNALGQNARAQEPLLSYPLLLKLRLSSISSKRLAEGRWRDDGKRHQGLVARNQRSVASLCVLRGVREMMKSGIRAW